MGRALKVTISGKNRRHQTMRVLESVFDRIFSMPNQRKMYGSVDGTFNMALSLFAHDATKITKSRPMSCRHHASYMFDLLSTFADGILTGITSRRFDGYIRIDLDRISWFCKVLNSLARQSTPTCRCTRWASAPASSRTAAAHWSTCS